MFAQSMLLATLLPVTWLTGAAEKFYWVSLKVMHTI